MDPIIPKLQFGNPAQIALARAKGHEFMRLLNGTREPGADCGCCLLWRATGRTVGVCALYQQLTNQVTTINARAEACGGYK